MTLPIPEHMMTDSIEAYRVARGCLPTVLYVNLKTFQLIPREYLASLGITCLVNNSLAELQVGWWSEVDGAPF